MKAIQFLRTVATIAIAVILLSSCSWVADPEPSLTVGVVTHISTDTPYECDFGGKNSYYTHQAVVKSESASYYVRFPGHLSDVIVEGTTVQFRIVCQDIWRYKDVKGKWHDVAWGKSIVEN